MTSLAAAADNPGPLAREAQRQRLLLQTLWQQAPDVGLTGWLCQDRRAAAAGIAAYRTNGQALAERALAAAYPTLAELVGAECFAALARDCWRQHPPVDGDMACYGDELIDLVAADTTLADEPYLADVARLDAMVQRCERAADAAGGAAGTQGLDLLADGRAPELHLVLRPGTQVLASRWPVVAVWQAHRRHDGDRFTEARQAFAEHTAQCALVGRDGWRAVVAAIHPAEAQFTLALLQGLSLGDALAAAGDEFSFEHWLPTAVQDQRLIALRWATQDTSLEAHPT